MSISQARAIGLSGLRVQERRLSQSASNVANSQTDEYEARRVDAETTRGGGVTSHVTPTGAPAPVVVDEMGERTLSNTDLVQERVTQLQARTAFKANLAVIRTADEMEESLLDEKV